MIDEFSEKAQLGQPCPPDSLDSDALVFQDPGHFALPVNKCQGAADHFHIGPECRQLFAEFGHCLAGRDQFRIEKLTNHQHSRTLLAIAVHLLASFRYPVIV